MGAGLTALQASPYSDKIMNNNTQHPKHLSIVNTPVVDRQSSVKSPWRYVAKPTVIPMLSLALAASLPVHAQSEPGQFDLSPFAGYHMFESKQNLDDAFTYGVRLGYTITPHWTVEGAVSFVDTDVANASLMNVSEGQFSGPANNVDVMLYHVDALYHFRPEQKFSPYIVAGYGATDYKPAISDKDMTTFNLGAGAKYWFRENVALRFDLRNHFVGEVIQETYNNVSATVGLTFVFGGKSTPAAVVAKKPYIAAVAVESEAKEEVIVLELEDIHFDFDKSTLTSEAKTILQRSVTTLKKNPKAKVRIAGYTSESGTVEHNQALSERRAAAIKNYLVEQGIASRRLSTIGYGEARPESHEAKPSNLNSKAAKENMRALFEIIVE